MRDRRRQTAPGDLLTGDLLTGDLLTGVEGQGLAALAAEYGLRPSSGRPSLRSYLRLV